MAQHVFNISSQFDINSNDCLLIRNMKFAKEYKIKYYSPYDLVNSIKEETRWGPKLTLEFPIMDTMDVILFEVFRMGDSFKSLTNDSTNREAKPSRPSKVESTDEVVVYPNPNDGSFTVKLQRTTDVRYIEVVDQLGRTLDIRRDVVKENKYSKSDLSPGNYWVKIVFNDQIVRKKLIKN